MAQRSYDLVVIGGGPAGTVAANVAAIFGARVALVEKQHALGGAGINSGTVPSKTLRETALALSGWRSRQLFGVDLSLRREATIADFTRHCAQVVTGERDLVESRLAESSVERVHGVARFLDPHTVCVACDDHGERVLHADKIVIATGSSPVRPPEFPFADDRVHDSDELLHIDRLPKHLVIVGAGVIGSEYASTFAAMNVETQVVDGRDVLMPFLDGEISRALARAMTVNGVRFRWNERVTHVDVSRPGDVVLTLSSGGTLACDALLVCAGRQSQTAALDLAAAGITPGKRGLIPVDDHFRSEVPHIYAAGDVVGPPALAATGMEQARVAACHAMGVAAKTDVATLLPSGIYTIPEASMAGETEESLTKQGVAYVAGCARYADNPRGRIIGDDAGFLKLLFRRDDLRLVGVHVIGEQATELIHVGLTAMMLDATAQIFDRICFNYPTLGDLYKLATYDAFRKIGAVAQPPSEVTR
jgi:NAD(P) transhydrogenase